MEKLEPTAKRSKTVAAENNISSTSGSGSNGKDGEKVKIRVSGQDTKELTFRLNRDTKLFEVLHLYCRNTASVFEDVQFMYKSNRIYGFHTPRLLGMKKNKTYAIDAMKHVHGGGSSLHHN